MALRAGPARQQDACGRALQRRARTSSLVIVPSGPVPLTLRDIDAFFFSQAARLRRDLRPRCDPATLCGEPARRSR